MKHKEQPNNPYVSAISMFSFLIALAALVVLSPLLAVIAALVKLDSPGPVFFRQERVGRHFQPFRIYKFRTMAHSDTEPTRLITAGRDPRVTRIGAILRQLKLDEFPQLINIVKRDMNFVGPRPEVKRYVDLFPEDYRQILSVRPGITDLASLKYRNETDILGSVEDPEDEYVHHILPDKIRLAKEYVRRSSPLLDLSLILKTVLRTLG